MQYKPVIGLEIHAELKTKTKMFCDSLNNPDEKHPNFNVCPICMGHPGTLPVINEEAIKKVITAGFALDCTIARDTFFERKNYFYPDLPKGYQISQYQKPLCENGYLEIKRKKFRVTRIHLEEDAGRLYHLPDRDYSLVDYNRAGVPLMELVTEPDFETGQEVKDFASELQLIWQYLNISEANMEKGEMRVEVNISLTNPDGSWGTKVEVKNLNSIKFAADAADFEIKRQKDVLESGGTIHQETRGWDENKKATFSQRSKEEAHDYRYFPEPDLPLLRFDDDQIAEIKDELFELPRQRRERFKGQYNLPDNDIEMFTVDKELGNYFEHVASELADTKLYKLAANYLITELRRMALEVNAEPEETKITPEMFADLIKRVHSKEISSSGAQMVIKEMFETGKSPEQIIKEKDLGQVSDMGELESAVIKVLEVNLKAVDDFKAGKEGPLKFLIGMVMRETKGKANPQVVEQIIKDKLK